MKKTFLASPRSKKVALIGSFSGLFVVLALAQNSVSTPAIGFAQANTKQHQILDGALSSQTRQTLQEAMNSTPDSSHPAPANK